MEAQAQKSAFGIQVSLQVRSDHILINLGMRHDLVGFQLDHAIDIYGTSDVVISVGGQVVRYHRAAQ